MHGFSALHVGHFIFAIYAALAVSVAVKLSRNAPRAFDDVFTDNDRALVGSATFYLGLPAVLLLIELMQVALLLSFGAALSDVQPWLEHDRLPSGARALSTIQVIVLCAAGSALAALVGGGSLWLALKRPRNAAWNFARLELGRIVIGVALIIHPAICWVLGHGSAHLLRLTLNGVAAHVGDAFVALYAIAVIAVLRFSGKRRFQRWYVELATPLFHAIETARARVAANPSDADAQRDLGGTYLAAARFDFADTPLTRSAQLNPNDARTQFLLGMLRLKQERAADAELALCRAGQLLDDSDVPAHERRGLELEVVLALASARLRLNDAAGALETAEAALQLARRDPRVLVVYSDALVALGRVGEAREPLSRALQDAHGPVEGEIRRRLAALERGR